jgi:hypothetical protein
MASTSFAGVLPTQATRRAAMAALAVVARRERRRLRQLVGRRRLRPLGQPRHVHGNVVGFDKKSGIRTTTPIRRTTPHSSPSPRSRPTTVRGSVPAILVGTWSGGSEGETAGTSYTFASDGRFLIRRPGGSITGGDQTPRAWLPAETAVVVS